VWFNLGDRDLAVCLERKRRLDDGARLTDALRELGEALGLTARVLPMCDEPVRTWVRADGRWQHFQDFMIRSGGAGPVEGVEFRGVDEATPPPEALAAIAAARAIVIGPSNPVISIAPILAVPGVRAALAAAPAAVIAVSPIVGGQVVKGPTEPFMAWAGHDLSADGIAQAYDGVIDGLVTDEPCEALPSLRTDTLMNDAAGRRRVAEETLGFCEALKSGR
jgi:LPPG:FO 2-phospho-L-lactate transferase